MKTYKMFLSDLNYVNEGHEWSIIPFPLNVGYQAAYLHKMLPGRFETRIFKDPRKFLAAIEAERPDVVALSNYMWNKNLQLEFAKHIKRLYPHCITVMGGPNYNFIDREWIERFVRRNPSIDFHIEGEGEPKLYNLMACALEHDLDFRRIAAASPAGACFLDPASDEVVVNDIAKREGNWNCLDEEHFDGERGRMLDLDDIPSPYLTHLLDEFLEDPYYCPIIETNRGCPYSCTFCAWGAMSKSKSSRFSMERVIDELRYIAEHNAARAPYLYFGDANFGLFPRDIEIAREVKRLKESHGFPQNVFLYFAKNSTEKVVQIAEILKDMTPISLARQSQNDQVLENVKRSNISVDMFNRLAALSKSLGVDSSVDIIYGLPGESKQTLFAGLREIAKQNIDALHLYAASLLEGSEMATLASREQFGMKGEWRMIDGCAGSYGPIRAMEFEEIVTSTNAMSRDDFFQIRLFHFLQCLFLDYKIYKDLAVLLDEQMTIVDLIEDLIRNYRRAKAPFRRIVEEFIRHAHVEMLPAEPTEFPQNNIDKALRRSVKLNPLFICKLLYDPGARQAFHDLLEARLPRVSSASPEAIAAVIEFIDAHIYEFDGQDVVDRALPIDAAAFARRDPYAHVDVSEYLLEAPRVYRLSRRFSYMDYIREMDDGMPLAEKVYDVVVHHTHETHRNTLVYQLVDDVADPLGVTGALTGGARTKRGTGARVIRNEGGWLY